MKRTIILLTTCFVIGASSVVALYAINKKIVHKPNNFLRTYYNKILRKRTENLDLKYNSYYLAGIADNNIYLGNVSNPLHLIKANYTLTDTQHVRLNVSIENLKSTQSIWIKIGSPYFYIVDGNMPWVLRGKLNEWIADRFIVDSTYFSQIVPINGHSFGIRTQLRENGEYILGKIQLKAPHQQLKAGLLQKQIDGFFCTDGVLNYNSEINKLVYTYYYRNEYIVYDTNLRLDYRGHTIDTFSRAQLTIGYITSDSTATLTSRKTINTMAQTSGNCLFIASNLMAKNDISGILDTQTIIDVYDLRYNRYKFSFTITNLSHRDKVRDFRIFQNKLLVVLFDHELACYELQEEAMEQIGS